MQAWSGESRKGFKTHETKWAASGQMAFITKETACAEERDFLVMAWVQDREISSCYLSSLACSCQGPDSITSPDCPCPAPRGFPRTQCQTLGPSAPAPAVPQQGRSPAPHSPAQAWPPLSQAHLQAHVPAWAWHVPIPREVPGTGAVPVTPGCLLLAGGGMGPGCQALPRGTHGDFLRDPNGFLHGCCHQERVCAFLFDPLLTPWLPPGSDSPGGEGGKSEPVLEPMHKKCLSRSGGAGGVTS